MNAQQIYDKNKRSIDNYDRTIRLGPCHMDGAKPRLVNTHVACSNPRCDMYKVAVRDTSWNTRYEVDGMSARSERTWEEDQDHG